MGQRFVPVVQRLARWRNEDPESGGVLVRKFRIGLRHRYTNIRDSPPEAAGKTWLISVRFIASVFAKCSEKSRSERRWATWGEKIWVFYEFPQQDSFWPRLTRGVIRTAKTLWRRTSCLLAYYKQRFCSIHNLDCEKNSERAKEMVHEEILGIIQYASCYNQTFPV